MIVDSSKGERPDEDLLEQKYKKYQKKHSKKRTNENNSIPNLTESYISSSSLYNTQQPLYNLRRYSEPLLPSTSLTQSAISSQPIFPSGIAKSVTQPGQVSICLPPATLSHQLPQTSQSGAVDFRRFASCQYPPSSRPGCFTPSMSTLSTSQVTPKYPSYSSWNQLFPQQSLNPIGRPIPPSPFYSTSAGQSGIYPKPNRQ